MPFPFQSKKNIYICAECGSGVHEVEFTKGINSLTGDEWFETGWWCDKCENEVEYIKHEKTSKKQTEEVAP